jgi:hypothetical protein
VDIRIGERSVVALQPAEGRVRVGLVMPVAGRVIDVSVQPISACSALEEAGRSMGFAPTSVEALARQALVVSAGRAGTWQPPQSMCLLKAFGGVAFPLLAAAYDSGAAPLSEVPRWAGPILAAPTMRQAAAVAFGPKATRPVRRGLVEAVRPVPSGEIDLAALALALIGRETLEPDQLARVLCSDRVRQPAMDLPDSATMRESCITVREWGAARIERLLLDAAARADGVALLLETMRYARQLGDHGPPQPLPSRLADLHDVHRALMRSPSSPDPAFPTTRVTSSPRRNRRQPQRALPPPVTRTPVRPDTPITAPPAVRSINGHSVGELRFLLPDVVGDLARWGRLLSNCLEDFGPSVAAGDSVVIGVLRDRQLVYVIEVTPDGNIRQFSGKANRPPTECDRRSVIETLVRAGVLDPRPSANRFWLDTPA